MDELSFIPFPEIATTRLLLRQLKPADDQTLFMLRSNREAMKYIDRPIAASVDDARDLMARMDQGLADNSGIVWMICLKDQPDDVIGTIGYHRIDKPNYRAEIGYMLHPDFHRKGLMQEAIMPVINYGFDAMKLHSIEANVNPNNEASIGILLKNGFLKEAHYRENYFYNGRFLDSAVYSLLDQRANSKPF